MIVRTFAVTGVEPSQEAVGKSLRMTATNFGIHRADLDQQKNALLL